MEVFYSLNPLILIFQALYLSGNFQPHSPQRGWQGSTIPMAWSTFWVHPSEQILLETK